MRRIASISVAAALALTVGVLPAGADEPGSPSPDDGVSSVTELVAAALGMSPEEVLDLRGIGLGFGDIFQLKTLTSVLGLSTAEFLEGVTLDPQTGEYQFDWDALRETLSDAQLALLAELPRNLGAVISAVKRHHGRDEHQPDHAGGRSDDPVEISLGDESQDAPDDTRGHQPDAGAAPDDDDARGHKPDFAGKGGKSGKSRHGG